MGNLKQLFGHFQKEFSGDSSKDDHVLIIDGLNSFIRVFSAVPSLNDDGQHVGGVLGFLKSIGSNIKQFRPTRCIVIFDGVGGSARRRKIYPDYKGNRKNKSKLNRYDEFKDIVDEAESMKRQFGRLVKYFDTLPLTIMSIDHVEADDVIAYIATEYYKNVDNKITIVSSDRDFLQLINDDVQIWSPIKKKLYNPELLRNEFNLNSENYLLYRVLSGDASDNIPGVKGVGLKTLMKRFPQIEHETFTVDKLIECAQNELNNGSKLKLFQQIVSNKDVMERNNQLMQLRKSDISASIQMNISRMLDNEINGYDKRTFKELFLQDKLYSGIKDVDSWLQDVFTRLSIYAR